MAVRADHNKPGPLLAVPNMQSLLVLTEVGVRYALSALLAAHGVAHLVGFLVPWKLIAAPDMPFKTTLLAGRVDVGEAGIRVVGVLWLLTAVVMVATALGLAVQARWAGSIVLPVLAVSLVLCLVELPHARIGLVLNGVLVPLLLLHPALSPAVMRWEHTGDSARARLDASAHVTAETFTSASVDSLPPPVARYFLHVLTDGQPIVTSASFTQQGQFRMGESEDSWRPMRATQHFGVREPGFVWDARIDAYPLLPVFVRDSYVQGEAGMRASVLGFVTVMNAPSSPDLNSGALQRYLGETVWFPTALLPASGVEWTAIDDRSALATLKDHGTTVSLAFHFNDQGEVDSVSTPSRLREVKGQYIPTPWVVTCRDYAVHNGMRIPTYCEAAWILKTGRFTYWKGRLILTPPFED